MRPSWEAVVRRERSVQPKKGRASTIAGSERRRGSCVMRRLPFNAKIIAARVVDLAG